MREEWFNSYKNPDIDFIYDGATDPTLWIESRWRIMCLLKEAHGGGKWNHAEAIKEADGLLRVGGTANQATHYRMIEWLHAIECTLDQADPNIEKDRKEDYREARKTMLRSAWVNIKKANGVATSDYDDLNHVVKKDARFLRQQIDLLSPRLILCGNTFGLVKDELFPGYKRIPGADCSYHQGQDRIMIDYWHPARKSKDSWKPLVEEIRSIRKAGFLLK